MTWRIRTESAHQGVEVLEEDPTKVAEKVRQLRGLGQKVTILDHNGKVVDERIFGLDGGDA